MTKKNRAKKEKKPIRRIGHLLDPKVDIVFKQIFGKDKEIFAGFVNSVLMPPDQKRIVDVVFSDKDLSPKYERDKESRLDVLATLKDGTKIDIEIQLKKQFFFEKRALYYWGRLYSEQLHETESYAKLRPVICISLLDWIHYPEYKDIHTKHRMINDLTGKQAFHDIEIHFVEIPKFDPEMRSELSKWLHFLLAPVDEFQDSLIKRAQRTLDVMSKDEAMREAYDARLKEMRDQEAHLQTMESIAREKGREEGIEIGEGKATHKIIERMLASGMADEVIVEIVGVSLVEVHRARRSFKG